MLLRSIATAAVLLTAIPAFASPDRTAGTLTKAEKNAETRCMMRQLHTPAGRGVGTVTPNCTQIARDEIAALAQRQALASTAADATVGRD